MEKEKDWEFLTDVLCFISFKLLEDTNEGPIITISIPEMRKQQQKTIPDNSLEETQQFPFFFYIIYQKRGYATSLYLKCLN